MSASTLSQRYVRDLSESARAHRVVHHPYLTRLAAGDLPDLMGALRDFAHQYSFYSASFTQYLSALIGTLDNPADAGMLLENLAEEEGRSAPGMSSDHPKAGVSHAELFMDFQRTIGVTDSYREAHPPIDEVIAFRRAVLDHCTTSAAAGCGALGFATELIVPLIYQDVLEALVSHSDLDSDDYFFFEIHAECDVKHSEDLLVIAADLASDARKRSTMRGAMLETLEARARLWDALLKRALRMAPSQPSVAISA